MSLDPAASLQTFSPTSSGRSSPSPRVPRKAAEDALFKKDKGFRRYASGVERALSLWDTAQQEWADYISFLGRLLKAIQAHPTEIPIVPHSNTVATRLAQCLNPALPSGVHQKALEVYAYIFSIIGVGDSKDALSRDLHLYFPGLATVLSFASLTVRPLFLSLFEKYILKLDGAGLRPALKAIILCLLPGLEDETSEDFDRMVQALDKVREAVSASTNEDEEGDKGDSGTSHFWQCLFLASITNTSRRQGALAFLVRRLPKFGTSHRRHLPFPEFDGDAENLPQEAEAAVSPEPGLLIRCFEAGLKDPQLLIQRGFLDLLVSNLPLDSPVLQQRINKDDLERLVAAASGVVSRRDMSLNRRLWAWFLGPEPSAEPDRNESLASPTADFKSTSIEASSDHATYFSQYGLQALTRSIMKMVERPSLLPSDRARPFRLCLSLMDRWEVGGLIVPEIFLPALQSAQTYSDVAAKEQMDEVLRSASVFFDGVESGLIWGKLNDLLSSALSTDTTAHEEALRRIKLAKFILGRFNLKEEEMLTIHMPLVVLSTLSNLNKMLVSGPSFLQHSTEEILQLAYEVVETLVQFVPERALRGNGDDPGEVHLTGIEILQRIHAFYSEAHGNLDFADTPFNPKAVSQLVLREAGSLFCRSIQSNLSSVSPEICSRILSVLIYKASTLSALDGLDLVSVFQKVLRVKISPKTVIPPFPHLTAMSSVLTALQTAHTLKGYISASQYPDLVHPLIASIWHYLSPFEPKYHVEAVRCLWQLNSISAPARIVEAGVTALMIQSFQQPQTAKTGRSAESGRRFAVLWTHTMNEQTSQTERRSGSVSRRLSGPGPAAAGTHPGVYQSMLTRPLFVLLDALAEEGTELSAFVKGWLQDLSTLDKVFEVLFDNIESLDCLMNDNTLSPTPPPTGQRARGRSDDSKECLYILRHLFNVIKRPSQLTWLTLAEELSPRSEDASVIASPTALQARTVWICLRASAMAANAERVDQVHHMDEIHHTAVSIMCQVYQTPFPNSLKDIELEVHLMKLLRKSTPSLQTLLLEAILAALKLRIVPHSLQPTSPTHQRKQSRDIGILPRLSLAMDRNASEEPVAPTISPPPQLIDCLRFGFSSMASRLVLDDWVKFLAEVLPLFADTIFQNLLPLVECFCTQIDQTFDQLRLTFTQSLSTGPVSPESTIISLMNGLEEILAKAHDRLVLQETKTAASKSPEQPQGFFGNMVSGVFSSEMNQTRTPTANSRLTVLLCFQDTVRICFSIWSWGGYGSKDSRQDPTSLASFGYTSLRMRNRARRILEHLFAAEALECLETLAVLWCLAAREDSLAISIMSLLNVLNGSKPKHTIPAIFNAVYSRTNPNALDPNRMSTLTSDLSELDLVAFLVEYTKSLEDDAMDEIWPDCTIFLRDVLSNPLPHRQILPALLDFTAVIGQKVDNTNFGEQRRMRRELGDLFARLLTAVFTTRSMGFLQEPAQIAAAEKTSNTTNGGQGLRRSIDVVVILTSIVPNLSLILVDNDRITSTATSISTNVIGPTFHAKTFPENVPKSILDLLYQLTRAAQTNKSWKKDVADAFNDPRFFNTSLSILSLCWLPILAQWTLTDKDRIPDLLSRLSAPSAAGIVLGIGANSARQEADRKTQLTLRRIAILLLAAPEDSFTPNLPAINEKIVELLTATPTSSPSSATRPELFMLLRAVVLKTSPIHLAPLWPTINGELSSALSSLLPDAENKEAYSNSGILQACKLLDELVVLEPDDFQLLEWLFIADTIDAVYKPAEWYPISLADEIAEVLSSFETPTSRLTTMSSPIHTFQQQQDPLSPKRKLFIDPLIEAVQKEENADVKDMQKREMIDRVIRPFLGQLSMVAFEATYGMGIPDWEGCWRSCVKDVHKID